jgi:Family of unknown function (DUF6114)
MGAFSPFGNSTIKGQIIKGDVKCNGCIISANPDGADLKVVGWGLRQSFIWTTMAVVSVISIGTGVVLIIGGYSIYGKPETAGKWGVAMLVASVVSLFSMGGFFIGPILGVIGGILALTRK